MIVQKCSNGCLMFNEEPIEECEYCDSTVLVTISTANELMELAENETDKEYKHLLADASLMARIREIDHNLWERYFKLWKSKFWYS